MSSWTDNFYHSIPVVAGPQSVKGVKEALQAAQTTHRFAQTLSTTLLTKSGMILLELLKGALKWMLDRVDHIIVHLDVSIDELDLTLKE